jgi:hypothetical protein
VAAGFCLLAGVFMAMNEFFPAEMRRNPFPFYDAHRESSPVLQLEPFDLWLILITTA